MKLIRSPEGEHDTLGVELTEVSSHSTPSLRNGVDWRARRHTSSRFVEGSGLSPVRNIPDDEKLRERRQEIALSAWLEVLLAMTALKPETLERDDSRLSTSVRFRIDERLDLKGRD